MLDLKSIFDPDRIGSTPSPQPELPDWHFADLDAAWHLLWDEHAAVLEYDGGLPREWAEALALAQLLDQRRQTEPRRENGS